LEISKVQLERELQEERLKRAIEMEKAQAQAAVNQILADSVTPAYVTYRQLEALQTISGSENTKFVPIEMLSSMAGQVMLGNSDNRR
jgi:regulator of protease activity HflC (stomatin/prohibitin superfamily)